MAAIESAAYHRSKARYQKALFKKMGDHAILQKLVADFSAVGISQSENARTSSTSCVHEDSESEEADSDSEDEISMQSKMNDDSETEEYISDEDSADVFAEQSETEDEQPEIDEDTALEVCAKDELPSFTQHFGSLKIIASPLEQFTGNPADYVAYFV